jgi:hypothetical protein
LLFLFFGAYFRERAQQPKAHVQRCGWIFQAAEGAQFSKSFFELSSSRAQTLYLALSRAPLTRSSSPSLFPPCRDRRASISATRLLSQVSAHYARKTRALALVNEAVRPAVQSVCLDVAYRVLQSAKSIVFQ